MLTSTYPPPSGSGSPVATRFLLAAVEVLMRSLPVRILVALIGVALAVSAAHAQLQNGSQWPVPRLNFLMPLGGKPGTSVEVSFGGTDCDEPESLWFSHPGIKGTPIVPEAPKVDPKDPKKEMKK